ncbi:isochorismatase family protein [Candidatus Nitrotoga sp. 1052]|uniref:isochorismatase family protein n=1 Tax=Candidatus Nitrotoga sp. 1052 TaxID=2886964 RepID=UPI001EF5F787|nr:isochorismatase family protein [Candidatus Nitrotoga sp. 1052]CAH1089788.1 Nicotinamidase [Candidatus Nitrotoga sp. 1052]
MNTLERYDLQPGDALLVTDIQNDFLSGGSLAVPGGDEVVPVLNRYIDIFVTRNLPVFVTRDWHPEHHCSFRAQGGPWPPHCIVGTHGAEFAAALRLPPSAVIISKATTPEHDAYSSFLRTDLDRQLRDAGIRRIFIGGLTTDYCVLNTTRDALQLGYQVFVLVDAIRAVDVQPGDGQRAVEEMIALGAKCISLQKLAA